MQHSLWTATPSTSQYTSLKQDLTCEVCIVGGGITGVQTALQLAKAGFDTCLIEAHTLGEGTTGHSTGKLTAQHGSKLRALSKNDAKAYYTLNAQAIEHALKDFPSSLFEHVTSYAYATSGAGKEKLLQEAERYKELDIPIQQTTETELPFPVALALGLTNQLQCNPIELVQHIATKATQHGAAIFTHSRATKIFPHSLELENGCRIHFKKLFLCTHYPIASLQNLRSLQLSVHRSYLTASPFADNMTGQYISVDSSNRTIRTANLNNQIYLLYGGSTHLAGATQETEPYYNQLTNELQYHFDITTPSYHWSAQDVQSPTQLPYIEAINDTIYIATGYDKWGLSNALVASEAFLSFAKGEQHPAHSLFQASWAPSTWFKTLQTAGFISVSLMDGYVSRPSTPKCTHLGCKTNWNEADHTWDCPCHGSRYSADGQVIEGPAVYPLKLTKGSLD